MSGMEAVQRSEMLVNSYQSAQCYNPEDSHLHNNILIHICDSDTFLVTEFSEVFMVS
jgi:hypothetical protein